MKIAVCGSGSSKDKDISKLAGDIGIELSKKGVILLTGACLGYPHKAAIGSYSHGGTVIGISPARDLLEHKEIYHFPDNNFKKISFTGLGIPARNFSLVSESDAIIIIGGQAGTLNEFTIALAQNKPIGVLDGSGGITMIIKDIAGICDKNGEKENIVYSKDPKDLVDKLLKVIKYNKI